MGSTVYYLHTSAKDGYKGYLNAYTSHSQREIFDVQKLDLNKVARSFGLTIAPKVELKASKREKTRGFTRTEPPKKNGSLKTRKGPHGRFGSFSAENPYGGKSASQGDKKFKK